MWHIARPIGVRSRRAALAARNDGGSQRGLTLPGECKTGAGVNVFAPIRDARARVTPDPSLVADSAATATR